MIEACFDEYFNMLKYYDEDIIKKIAKVISEAGVVVFCGNGGSYANATHMAGDILMNTNIKGNTIAIGDNLVSFSACSNDVCYDKVFSVELEKRTSRVVGSKVIVLLSTSGKSKNILDVGRKAKNLGFIVVSMIGRSAEFVKEFSDVVFTIDSVDAGFIEAVHGFIGHVLVRLINNI